MTRKKHGRTSLWSDFPVFPLVVWKMAYHAWAGLWFSGWSLPLEGRIILQNYYRAPEWSLPIEGPVDGHIFHVALRWQRTSCSLKTFLLFLSISTDVIDVPGASRWVVGISRGFTGKKAENVGTIPYQGACSHSGKLCKRDSNCVCSWAGLTSDRNSDSENVLPGGQETQWGLCHLQSSGDLMH